MHLIQFEDSRLQSQGHTRCITISVCFEQSITEPPFPCMQLLFCKRSHDQLHVHVMMLLVIPSCCKMMLHHRDVRSWRCTSDVVHHSCVTNKNVKNHQIWHEDTCLAHQTWWAGRTMPHMCTCMPRMKFLCLTLCPGELYTDDNDDDANDDGQFMIV